MATPSIAMIPSGYKDGKVYSVLPNSADGDFDFTRGSAATRVNAQGLVENVQILSSELVSNGDFSQEGSELITNGDFATDSDWSKGTNWTISGGSANCDGISATSNLSQVITSFTGKTFLVEGSASNVSQGFVYISLGGTDLQISVNSSGSFKHYVTISSGNSTLFISARNNFIGSIDNVSVKEVGQDWTEGVGVTISGGSANFTGNANAFLTQSNVVSSGKTYKATFTVSNYVSGAIDINLGGSTRQGNVSANGTYTFYISVSSGSILYFQEDFSNGFTGSIDNVSVKETTDDTDIPRLDYSDGSCPSLLLEPQSTNLLPYSEDFSQWNNIDATLISNQLSPDGQNSAYVIEGNSVGSFERIDKTTTTNATPHTFSVFIKKKTSAVSSYSGIQMGTSFSYVIFDSYNGTYNTSLNTNYDSIEVVDFNSDWWVLKLTATVTTSTRIGLWGAISEDGINISTSATGSETFFGAQLEEQSHATSYIPTNGSIVTRLADVATNSGNASLINSTEGVLYAEISALGLGASSSLGISDGSGSNRVLILLQSSGDIRGFIASNGAIVFDETYSGISTLNNNKIAVSYKLNQFILWINGVKRFTDTSGNTPIGLSDLSFDNGSGGSIFHGKVKALAVYKEALTDAELQSLTTI